jgi:hypothetical protein
MDTASNTATTGPTKSTQAKAGLGETTPHEVMGGEPVKESCVRCRFWLLSGPGNSFGPCRRRPPVSIDHVSCWPKTWSNDWCGEFEARK